MVCIVYILATMLNHCPRLFWHLSLALIEVAREIIGLIAAIVLHAALHHYCAVWEHVAEW